MTSTSILFLQPGVIIIPEDRQRKLAKADETLITSIRSQGVLNPIIIADDYTLIAGERRLDACRTLGISVPCRLFSALSPLEAFKIELMENIARAQLTWQDEIRAIAAYHQLRLTAFPGWTQMGTAEDLGIDQSAVSRAIAIASELEDPAIFGCQTASAAQNYFAAKSNRIILAAKAKGFQFSDAVVAALAPAPASLSIADATASILAMADGSAPPPITAAKGATIADAAKLAAAFLREQKLKAPAANTPASQIIHAQFGEWASTYSDIPFDVIHCDFPYGKNWKGSGTSRQAEFSQPVYDDSEDVLWKLLEQFFHHQERFVSPQAHCIFWMAMEHYSSIIQCFTRAGWRLSSPYPLIWTKGNAGAPGDPIRRYRHCYETALLFSRGDRKIVKMMQDHFAANVETGEDKLHLSQKPVPMLRHFLSGIADEHSRVLDPTCGSGSAIAAANLLQVDYAVGVEMDSDNVDIARLLVDRQVAAG